MYTFAELGDWVHLLTKRARGRNDFAKYDDDLQQASNYLSMMYSELSSMRDPMNLDRFSDTILNQLSAANRNIRLSYETTSNVLSVSWKIPDLEIPKTFKNMYDLYVGPALLSLTRELKNVDEVFVLEGVSDLGDRVSIAHSSDTMLARLKTWYHSDNGSGDREKTGTMMSIEVGIAEE